MTPAEQAEADQATLAFHTTLTAIGATALRDSLVLWDEVPTGSSPRVVRRWVGAVTRLVSVRRSFARDLALAYYRLVRALSTGSTVADPRRQEPERVPLNDLRDQFAALVADTPAPSQEGGRRASSPRSDDTVTVEPLPNLEEDEEAVESAAQQEAEIVLEALGPANQQKKVEEIGTEGDVPETDTARDEAHLQAGARQAAAVERLVLDGGRSELWSAMKEDKRVLGYIRFSTTGTPCGWCAMLISRGPVYRSEKSATYAEGDLYHDNCHCEALPIFSEDDYDSSSLYALNRRYEELWPTVTRGLSGKAAVSAWRRFIRQEQKSQRAQAARSTTSVQEA